jgi:5'-3' exonuclease
LFFLQNIGVRVVFFFDGMTPESQRVTWVQRRQRKVDNISKIFEHLDKNPVDQAIKLQGMLPSLVAATASFVAKYVCGCDVHRSVSDCDVEMARFAQKEDCFAILSQDTDFVILQGARHFLTVEKLNLETMTTLAYSQEGLLKFLGLEPQQLFLLASLLGNDIVPVSKLTNFHNRLKQAHKGCELLHNVVNYIKK